jgi:hypothetical protein
MNQPVSWNRLAEFFSSVSSLHGPGVRIAVIGLTCLLVTCRVGNGADDPSTFTVTVEVDLGRDIGQSFGSLFEIRNSKGRVVAGAGFPDAYNTRFRTGRHRLQYFIRPDSSDREFEVERLPHPDLDCGVYLCEFDDEIYAWTSVRNNSVRRWDRSSRKWVAKLPPGIQTLKSGDGVMRVGNGRLAFSGSRAWFNDRQILDPPAIGRYYNFYYADGHLFFYHLVPGEDQTMTRIYACPWTSQDSTAIDLSEAAVLTTKYERETPFVWGQYQTQVLTVSNQGGIYVFSDGAWKTTLEADNTVSYQVYAGLHWHDRLLLAQYPTGNVFEYQGAAATRKEGWPPVMPGVSTRARECQTLGIYGGDLLAGVWPWAELWRYDRDATQWHAMGRMFTHPELTAERTHPYEEQANRFGLVTNHWGQRVTSMIPHGDSLYLSTSSKGTYEWSDRYDFLTEEQRREYGSVLRLRMPGNLSAQMRWKESPTRLTFQYDGRTMSIQQDGTSIATARLERPLIADLADLKVSWSQGVYGPLNGELRKHSLEQ